MYNLYNVKHDLNVIQKIIKPLLRKERVYRNIPHTGDHSTSRIVRNVAKQFQKVPKRTKSALKCPTFSKGTKKCRHVPKGVKRCQKVPKVPKGSQKVP